MRLNNGMKFRGSDLFLATKPLPLLVFLGAILGIQGFSGPPGSRSRHLGSAVFPDGPCKSVTVQICWWDEADDPSTCSKMLSDSNSWLDNWLDQIEFMGMVDITFAE
jgi:hypothetical protein